MKYIKSVLSLKLDQAKCIGCSTCFDVCPHLVFKMENNKAYISDKESCMECGACKLNCPTGAIEVNSGVGCAYAVINGLITGTEPSCDCGNNKNSSSCC